MQLHVAGSLELFKDNLIHLTAGINEGGCNNCQTAPLFNIPGSPEKPLGLMQGMSINTTGKNLAAGGDNCVVGTRQTGD